jgi:hypothetical protein
MFTIVGVSLFLRVQANRYVGMALIKEGNATPEFIFIPSKEEPSKESRFLEREILIYSGNTIQFFVLINWARKLIIVGITFNLRLLFFILKEYFQIL